MATYKIVSHDGSGLPLTVSGSGTINGRQNVCVSTDAGSNRQQWVVSSLSNDQQIKSNNNQSYMLNAYRTNWNCDVYTSNSDTYIKFVPIESDRFRLQLASDTTKYLTAEGTASGSNVSWQAANNASSQIWRFVSGPALSQAGAVAWITNAIGQSAKDYPGNDGTQCVDLVKAYVDEYFKLAPLAFGDGPDVYSGVVEKYPSQFIKITATNGTMTLQPGDIVSMRGNAGHAALVKSVSGNSVTIAEQYKGSITVRGKAYTYTSISSDYFYLYGAARPIF